MEAAILAVLAWGILPAWLLAGLLDWWCHRRTDLAHTSGLGESSLHLLMLLQMGAAILAVLLLRINALVLLLLAVLWIGHQATSVWDSCYAAPRRHISVFEQHVHGFLDVLPLTALLLVGLLHRDQWLPLPGMDVQPEFSLAWKDPVPDMRQLAAVVAAGLLFALLPFAEEWLRARRAART
jgi:hypothetical protein